MSVIGYFKIKFVIIFQCKQCQKRLRTAQGLKSHVTRLHSNADPSTNCPPTQHSSQTFVKAPAANSPADNTTISDPSHTNSDVRSPNALSNDDIFLNQLNKVKSSTKILSRIPKGARVDAANVLSNTIDSCVVDNSVASWELLLAFSAICFQVPERTVDKETSLSTQVKKNIRISLSQGTSSLFFQNKKPFEYLDRKGVSADKFASKIEAKLAEGDVRGAVRILSSEDSFAPFDSNTYNDLLLLHPNNSKDLNFPSSDDERGLLALHVSEVEVKAAIQSFPAGSAGGPDMMRPQHLKDLISYSAGNAGVRLIGSLTKICNLMLSGQVPNSICPIIYGASLCALKKKNGGVRPIAIGCTLRRLVAKLGCHHISNYLGSKLQPHQLGFGSKGGAEAAAHSARRYIDFPHEHPRVLLKVDFRNAFNSVYRDVMLHTVLVQTPELYAFLKQCYKYPSHLIYGSSLLSSCRGIQQGDPLGSALFSMVVLPASSSLSSEFNAWFLDDVSIADTPDVVIHDFKTLTKSSAQLGLTVNPFKCELMPCGSSSLPSTTKDHFRQVISEIKCPHPKDVQLLGAPLTDEALVTCLTDKTRTLQLVSDRLSALHSHSAYHILKNSQAMPKLSYVLRCSPAWTNPDALAEFDQVLKTALESITNTSLSDSAFEQSSWPVSKGGLGVRQATKTALPAFLASSYSVVDLVGKILPTAISESKNVLQLEGMSRWCRFSNHEPPPANELRLQQSWESIDVSNSVKKQLSQASNSKEKARLLGVSARESGAFLNAIPSSALGTKLEDDAFHISIALRLGADMCQPHICKCGVTVDASGTHGLACKKSSGRFSRHAAVNDLLKRALSSAGVPSILEPAQLDTNTHQRPDGMTQIPWSHGKSLVWDFTCSDGMAPSSVQNSSITPLYAAHQAEKMKRTKYAHLATSYIFAPVAAECLGGLGKDSLSLIHSIGRKITSLSGDKRATDFLIQRISVAIQRGNATSIMGTLPVGASLNEYLYLL